MSVLPIGWVETIIPDVADVLDSLRVPLNANERASKISGKNFNELIPYFGATGKVGYTDGYLFNEDLVLLGEDGVPFFDPLKKKAYRIKGKSWVNNHAHVLKVKEGVLDWRLLEAQLNILNYVGYVSGSTRLKLTQAAMNKLPILVPPQAEQRRIAEKIDTVLARVDALNDRFARITPLLKRFRQSVLAAATSGRLTEDWRTHTDASWTFERADVVCAKVQSGGTPKSGFATQGIPFFKVYNIVGQRIAFDYRPQFVTPEVQDGELKKSQAKPGDVLMNIVGPPLGKVAIVTPEFTACNINQAITLFRPSERVSSNWLYIVLCEGAPIREILNDTKGSVGQVNISLSQCRSFELPIPSVSEQAEIVRRVEILFAYADRLEARLQTARTAADRLTPALLAKAFRGELVPQDPNDEPATELLRRLREARAAEVPAKKARGRKAQVA